MIRHVVFVVLFLMISQSANSQHQKKFRYIESQNGLSNNNVRSILQDSDGFIWVGTNGGLNRFDGYEFKIYKNNPNSTSTLSNNVVTQLVEDNDGNIWVGTEIGLNKFDSKTENFTRYLYGSNATTIPQDHIVSLKLGLDGTLWLGTRKSLTFYDRSIERFKLFGGKADSDTLSGKIISSMDVDLDGKLWVAYMDRLIVDEINPSTGEINQIHLPEGIEKEHEPVIYIDKENDVWLSRGTKNTFFLKRGASGFRHIKFRKERNTIVNGLIQDKLGDIWIGTGREGVYIYNKESGALAELNANEHTSMGDFYSDWVNVLHEDENGGIWLGTGLNGMAYHHPHLRKFDLHRRKISDPKNSLSNNQVNAILVDHKNRLWVGTNEGLNVQEANQKSFRKYFTSPSQGSTIGSNTIVSLLQDRDKNIWVGTYQGGLCRYIEDLDHFMRYEHSTQDETSISNNIPWVLYEDNADRLLIGTLGGGLNVMDKMTGRFRRYDMSSTGISSDYINSIAQDNRGDIWIGTAYGLNRLSASLEVEKVYLNSIGDSRTIMGNHIEAIYQDANDRIWVCSNEGLNLYDRANDNFCGFPEFESLSGQTIFTILEDERNNLWLGTNRGISKVCVEEEPDSELKLTVTDFDSSDGLQGAKFSPGAAFKSKDGKFYFGGIRGFNSFYPDEIELNKKQVEVLITGLKVFNQRVAVNDTVGRRVLLTQPIDRIDELRLNFKENYFSLQFAALEYLEPQNCRYAFKLTGFNSDWIYTDSDQREATFTNLDPGEYVFSVKATNGDGVWSEKVKSLNVVVEPPFWKTKLALILFALLIIAVLTFLRWIITARAKYKLRIEQEHNDVLRQHEVDLEKIKFFTNISHEIRTPLTLIISPLQELLKKPIGKENQKVTQLAYQNAKKLLNLVNQLLDLRKLEVQGLSYNPRVSDVIDFVKERVVMQKQLAKERGVALNFYSSVRAFRMSFDTDKLEKVVLNLTTNALKFTKSGGKIEVRTNVLGTTSGKPSDNLALGSQMFQLTVSDTGKGISSENLNRIFDRYYHIDQGLNDEYTGYGIGLSMVKEYVALHNGKIRVDSEVGRGSVFTIEIPVSSEPLAEVEEANGHKIDENLASIDLQTVSLDKENEVVLEKGDLKKVLLVEDNEDLLSYLKLKLSRSYDVLVAENGQEGLKQALEYYPDLIVSDIMMPIMDGIALCESVKSNPNLSHIPVILLTARSTDEQKLEGYQHGADDYITKPFNYDILELRIKSLAEKRHQIARKFNAKVEINPENIDIQPLDQQLIKKAIVVVEENISNSEFSVEEFSRTLGMSRTTLYKKFVSITGKTPIEFIRILRLKRAAQLLRESQMSISEVAYDVGFNHPKYFSKYFKEEFGMLPSKYIEDNAKPVNKVDIN